MCVFPQRFKRKVRLDGLACRFNSCFHPALERGRTLSSACFRISGWIAISSVGCLARDVERFITDFRLQKSLEKPRKNGFATWVNKYVATSRNKMTPNTASLKPCLQVAWVFCSFRLRKRPDLLTGNNISLLKSWTVRLLKTFATLLDVETTNVAHKHFSISHQDMMLLPYLV